MLKNIFLTLEYVGTNYFGFQIQNKKNQSEPSIQGIIEDALKRLFKRKIRITYASRTDRCVHAYGQAVNFKVDTGITLKIIKKALNSFLPCDIRIKTARIVPGDFHARFSCTSKVYRYIILNKKQPSVFWHGYAWHIAYPLNIERMQSASVMLLGRRDFSMFAKHASSYENCTREIKNISIKKKNAFLYIDIEANGFLRMMARNIVSFLVKAGNKKLCLRDVQLVLKNKSAYRNEPAPSGGLYLVRVKYT